MGLTIKFLINLPFRFRPSENSRVKTNEDKSLKIKNTICVIILLNKNSEYELIDNAPQSIKWKLKSKGYYEGPILLSFAKTNLNLKGNELTLKWRMLTLKSFLVCRFQYKIGNACFIFPFVGEIKDKHTDEFILILSKSKVRHFLCKLVSFFSISVQLASILALLIAAFFFQSIKFSDRVFMVGLISVIITLLGSQIFFHNNYNPTIIGLNAIFNNNISISNLFYFTRDTKPYSELNILLF